MSRLGRKLVDGKGGDRVVEVMSQRAILLRRVQWADCEIVWKWANDKTTRSASFDHNSITWESHKTWFQSKLGNPACVYFIAENQAGKPVGQIRFDILNGEAVVSASLGPEFRGHGLGEELIRRGSQTLLEETEVKSIRALIKENNPLSIRAFEKAGFTLGDKVVHKGVKTVTLWHGDRAGE